MLSALICGLNDSDHRVRAKAADEIGDQIRSERCCCRADVVAALRYTMADCDSGVRRQAEEALHYCGYEIVDGCCRQKCQQCCNTCGIWRQNATPARPALTAEELAPIEDEPADMSNDDDAIPIIPSTGDQVEEPNPVPPAEIRDSVTQVSFGDAAKLTADPVQPAETSATDTALEPETTESAVQSESDATQTSEVPATPNAASDDARTTPDPGDEIPTNEAPQRAADAVPEVNAADSPKYFPARLHQRFGLHTP